MAEITIPSANVTFTCAEDDTILRAALRAGIGVPYECNVGSCGNCRFEVLEGKVEHERENPPGWSERDLQRNRWLGCQARPLSDLKIKVPMRADFKSKYPPVRSKGIFLGFEDITHDIREFRFKVSIPSPFVPGQYGLIEVPGGNGIRAYSMANVTDSGEEWHFNIRRVPGGKTTSYLFDGIKPGDEVSLDGPYGLAYLREDAPRDILCLAGGSGLAPMVSITRAAAVSDKLQDRKIHFIYGGRSARDLCGEKQISDLPGFGSRILYTPAVSETSDGWTGRTGFVHEVALDMFGEGLRDMEIYFAGPPPMADAIMKMAVANKVPIQQLHFDKFY